MRVLIIEPTFVQGVPAARGKKIDVADSVGRDLIHAGKATVLPQLTPAELKAQEAADKAAAQKKK